MSARTGVLEPAIQPSLARATFFTLTLFCLAHFAIDLYSGALGALQPLLIAPFRMNFTEAGILAGVLSFFLLGVAAVLGLSLRPFPFAPVHRSRARRGWNFHLDTRLGAELWNAPRDGFPGRCRYRLVSSARRIERHARHHP